MVAMANAGDDNNNAQFFITDPFTLDNGTEVPAPLDRRSQFLDFNYSIVGILTSGFDLYQKIVEVPKTLGSDGAISQPGQPVTITKAKLLSATILNAVVKLTANGGSSATPTSRSRHARHGSAIEVLHGQFRDRHGQ